MADITMTAMIQGPSTAIAGTDLDVTDSDAVADTFGQAAAANREADHREGAVAKLNKPGRLVISGDLHDNRSNLQRIIKLARLDQSPSNHLILQEVIHGPNLINGYDLSIRTLGQIAALKVQYPDQVLIVQSNHELAQFNHEPISKNRADIVEAFDEGIWFVYGDGAERVTQAMDQYLQSLLLAVRCPNGVLAAHSLPSPRYIESFDRTILDRDLTEADLSPGGFAHQMVWGRGYNRKLADELARAWDVQWFVLGHQPVEMGWETEAGRIVILNSDHEHGMALDLDLGQTHDLDSLTQCIVPLNSVSLEA